MPSASWSPGMVIVASPFSAYTISALTSFTLGSSRYMKFSSRLSQFLSWGSSWKSYQLSPGPSTVITQSWPAQIYWFTPTHVTSARPSVVKSKVSDSLLTQFSPSKVAMA